MTDLKLPPGKAPRKVLIVGGLGAALFIGYSYWRRSQTPVAVDPNAVDPVTTSLPDPTLPTVTTTTVPNNTDVIATNSQWTQRATEYLSGQGFDGGFVSSTLGKFLQRRALTSAEQDVVLAALAAFGQPPSGGPYTVMSAPAAPAGSKLPSPHLSVRPNTTTPTSVIIQWTIIPGATVYHVIRDGKHLIDQYQGAGLTVQRKHSYQVVAAGTGHTDSSPSNTLHV